MPRRLFFLIFLIVSSSSLPGVLPSALANNRDVEIVEIDSGRPAGTIEVMGTVKVNRSKPIRGLVMIFEFLDVDGQLLTIKKQMIEQEQVEEGDEVDFMLVGDDVPRAVQFRIRMQDSRNMELSVEKAGPYSY